MQFPVLSVIALTPVIVGALIMLFPAERKNEVRVAALAGATVCLLLSIFVYFNYDIAAGGYQFVEKYPWVAALGINYHVGVNAQNTTLTVVDFARDIHKKMVEI